MQVKLNWEKAIIETEEVDLTLVQEELQKIGFELIQKQDETNH